MASRWVRLVHACDIIRLLVAFSRARVATPLERNIESGFGPGCRVGNLAGLVDHGRDNEAGQAIGEAASHGEQKAVGECDRSATQEGVL